MTYLLILILFLLIGALIMSAVILAALAAQTQAITDLQARVGAQSGITTAEADAIKAGIEANTATIAGVLA